MVGAGSPTRHAIEQGGAHVIYLAGASHINAILEACRAEGGDSPDFADGRAPVFRDWPLRDDVLPDRLKVASIYIGHIGRHWGPFMADMLPEGRLGIAAGFQELLAVAAADPEAQALFVSMRGEEYFHVGNLGVEHPYDFVLPERPDLAPVPSRPLLPLATVQHQLSHSLQRTLMALAAMRKLCPRLRIVRIMPPPPTASEDVTQWTTERGLDTHLTEHLPSTLRLKLWLLHMRMVAEGTASLGLEILPVPGAALHPGGLLRREYMADAIHGNARYGALVCRQMAALLTPALVGET